MTFYLDGEFDASASAPLNTQSSNNFGIGGSSCSQHNMSQYFGGKIDEVSLNF
jgi:hypothetical protein